MKFEEFLQLIKSTNIHKLEAIATLLTVILLIVWFGISDMLFDGLVPQTYNYLGLLLCTFVLGFSGFFQVVKKEMPWVMGKTIKGNLAVVSGYVLMISFWGVGLLGLYFVISEL